ncbi:hypothetical protein CSC3H3_02575 [Thalassospira marina]|uniref:Uncharacterized protein n=1 Tax=Thalassospira marina TaxID=2048283 RepID=A0ABM6Q5D0_9PROT|nr:hypothetical protein CSC3H3_02575 [Thalassospira marina]
MGADNSENFTAVNGALLKKINLITFASETIAAAIQIELHPLILQHTAHMRPEIKVAPGASQTL